MDLLAYAQIDSLEELAKANGIEVPRLRGYRLMAEELPYTQEEIEEMHASAINQAYDNLIHSDPSFSMNPYMYEYSSRTDALEKKYLTKDGNLRWDRIHGKRRKAAKYLVKKMKRAVRAECSMWNKYAGKDGVLYIHTRCGSGNWEYYGCKELENSAWYIERVDDWYDPSYCTIYARIQMPREVGD